jgi:CheY-like chemotaxis protein
MNVSDWTDSLLKSLFVAGYQRQQADESTCPEEELLACYIEKKLPSAGAEVIEAHLAECPRCRSTLLAVLSVEEAPNEVSYPKRAPGDTDHPASAGTEDITKQIEDELKRFEQELGLTKEERAPQPSSCVMVVDDDIQYLSSLVHVLSPHYRIVECPNGTEAMKRMSPQIVAVVLDIRMPGISGLDVARFMKKDYSDVPVIFNTGYPGDFPEKEIVREFCEARYVTKDNSDRLIGYIQQCAGNA